MYAYNASCLSMPLPAIDAKRAAGGNRCNRNPCTNYVDDVDDRRYHGTQSNQTELYVKVGESRLQLS